MSGTTNGQTRRGLLTGAALGVAVVAVEVARPGAAQAADGDPVRAGATTLANTKTSLHNDGDQNFIGDGLEVRGGPAGGSGLIARSFGGGSPGILAEGDANGITAITVSSASSGLYGENAGGGYGVAGRSNEPGGTAVYGEALGASGIAVRAKAAVAGTALKVEGKATFSRSGKRVFPAGSSVQTVALPGLTTAALILATLQKHAAGITVASAVPGSGSFVLRLTAPAPAGGLTVGYFVLN